MGFVQKEWLIYFYESADEPKDDWLYFIKDGFRHCGALGYVPLTGKWNHLEWTHKGIRHTTLDDEEATQILTYLAEFQVLRCPVKEQWQLLRIKDYTCVSFIMRLIGYYKWWIFTPYQLYCALKKAGYKDYYDKIRRKNAKEEKEQNTRRNN
jgi:hypothetical protein